MTAAYFGLFCKAVASIAWPFCIAVASLDGSSSLCFIYQNTLRVTVTKSRKDMAPGTLLAQRAGTVLEMGMLAESGASVSLQHYE